MFPMKELWNDKRKRFLIPASCLAFLLAAHSYRWMNAIYSHDSLNIVQTDRNWQIAIGRIFNPVYVWFRGYITAPVSIALFASAFLILSAALVVWILRLEKTVSIVLCCGFLSTFETLAFINGMFLPWLDVQMLALLFSVLAACFLTGKKSLPRYVAGVLSITAMLGLYQSYLETAVMLVCLVLLREALEGRDPKEVFFRGVRAASLIALGGALYALCLHIVLKATGNELADAYNGLVKMNRLTIPAILSLAKNAWEYTLRYLFFGQKTVHPAISGWIGLALAAVSLFGTARIAAKNRLGAGSVVLAVLLLLFLPLGGNCVYVVSLGMKHMLMNYSFVFFFVFAVMIFDMSETEGIVARIARRAVPLLCAVLLLNRVLFANQWYVRNELSFQAGMSFMTRLVTHMEDTEGYETGRTPVLILGHVDDNPEVFLDERLNIATDYISGTLHRLSLSYYDTYRQFFRYVMGYPVNMLPLQEGARYMENPEVLDMPVYPEEGSVRMLDGVLVIRLSEDLRPEDMR